jgi:F-type H+-transporting ATPase subunit b
MQIIPDPAFAAAMALPFVVTLLALWQLLFVPYRRFLDERDEATVGARHEAEAITARAEDRMGELEARLAKAREEAAAIRATHRASATEREQQVIEQARRAAEASIGDALQQIGAEAQAARATLRDTAGALSTDIAGRVLGRAVQPGSV